VTPILIVLIAGALAHGTVAYLTRTPEEDQTPRRWKTWHTIVTGIVSGILIAIAAALIWVVTGAIPPLWILFAVSDALTIAWRLRQHRARSIERRALQNLFERPSFGEGSR